MLKLTNVWNKFCALRFAVVGTWNTVFSYLVFACLYRFWGGGWKDIAVQFISAIIGITNAYVLHRFLTYRSHGVWWREYLRFYAVYGAQVVLTALSFFVFATWLGFNGYVVQLILTILFTVASYWAHRRFSFAGDSVKFNPSTIFFLLAMAFAAVTSFYLLPSGYVHWQDETQIIEMARGGITGKAEGWSMVSFGDRVLDSQSWGVYYVGGWILEKAYQNFGELGPRGITTTFLFLSSLLLWWYLRRKTHDDWVAAIVALIWCAYPQFPVSVRGCRVDIIALTFFLSAIALLQFRPKYTFGRIMLFTIVGVIAALAQFAWISVFMLAPIVLLEMQEFSAEENIPIRRRTALIVAACIGFLIMATILFLPFIWHLDTTLSIFRRIIELNTSQAKSEGFLWREFARFFFVFPGFYAMGLSALFIMRRTWLLAACFSFLALLSIATRIYEWRMLYFLPYAVVGASLLAAKTGHRRCRLMVVSVLCLMLAVSYSRTFIFRNLCDYFVRDARDYKRVVKILDEKIGRDVKIYNDCYDLYLAGRELGWEQRHIANYSAHELRKKMLEENNLFIGDEQLVESGRRKGELEAAGYRKVATIDCTVAAPTSRLGKWLFKTGRCVPVYGKYAVWSAVAR